MKITACLLRWAKPLPGGNIWRGKYKLHKKVTPLIISKMKEDLMREEQNMFYLRNPYLTPEQSYGHAAVFNHKKKFMDKCRESKLKWRDHQMLGDRFGFLKVSDAWE